MLRVARGWFKLWRKTFSCPSLKPKPGEQARALEAWSWLLAIMNYEENRQHVPPLDEGQGLVTLTEICTYTNWKRSRARSWLKGLERDKMITAENLGRATLVTVLNWPEYQNGTPHKERTETAQGTHKPRTAKSPESQGSADDSAQSLHDDCTTTAQGTHTSTEEEKKEEGKNTPPNPPSGGRRKRSRKREPKDPIVIASEKTGEDVVWHHPDLVAVNDSCPWPDPYLHIWDLAKRMEVELSGGCGGKRGQIRPGYSNLWKLLKAGRITPEGAYRALTAYFDDRRRDSGGASMVYLSTFFGPRKAVWENHVDAAGSDPELYDKTSASLRLYIRMAAKDRDPEAFWNALDAEGQRAIIELEARNR